MRVTRSVWGRSCDKRDCAEICARVGGEQRGGTSRVRFGGGGGMEEVCELFKQPHLQIVTMLWGIEQI